MFLTVLHPNRWFIWALAAIFIVGFLLIGYGQWVNLDLDANGSMMLIS